MKCQNCEEREALVHLTKIHNGEKKEVHLCESCAQKVNAFSIHQSFDFHKFFSGILDTDNPFSSKPKHTQELTCTLCGMKYSTFKKIGKVGCDHCYGAFEEYVRPLIRRIHGSEKHTGKIPHHTAKHIRIKREIEELRNKLQNAIENEEYELAAKLRDDLKMKNQELS